MTPCMSYPYLEVSHFDSKDGTFTHLLWKDLEDDTFKMSESDFIKVLKIFHKKRNYYIIAFRNYKYTPSDSLCNFKQLALNFFLKKTAYFCKNEILGEEYWTDNPPSMNVMYISIREQPVEWRPISLYRETDIYTDFFKAVRKGDLQLPLRVAHPQPCRYHK